MLQCVALCDTAYSQIIDGSVLQFVAICCSVLQCVALRGMTEPLEISGSVLQ